MPGTKPFKTILHCCLGLVLGLLIFILTFPAGAALAQDGLKLDFCGEQVPLHRPEVSESLDQELLLLSEAKSRVWLTLRRTDRYLPIVERALRDQSVPLDFKFLPLAVTNLSPVYRNGNRRGLWRLTENEAASLGLVISKDVDERLDPLASSAAVAKKLASLKQGLGTWTLALAAFIDPSATSTALSEAGNNDYYALYVPENLDKTVSLVLAGKLLYSSPSNYGYSRTAAWPVLAGGRRKLESDTNLRTAAYSLKIDIRTFKDMNPHILGETAPAGSFLNVP